jgi:hypothetical protein
MHIIFQLDASPGRYRCAVTSCAVQTPPVCVCVLGSPWLRAATASQVHKTEPLMQCKQCGHVRTAGMQPQQCNGSLSMCRGFIAPKQPLTYAVQAHQTIHTCMHSRDPTSSPLQQCNDSLSMCRRLHRCMQPLLHQLVCTSGMQSPHLSRIQFSVHWADFPGRYRYLATPPNH